MSSVSQKTINTETILNKKYIYLLKYSTELLKVYFCTLLMKYIKFIILY